MLNDMKEFAFILGGAALLVIALLVILMTPIAWCDGHAKSAYLKQSQGLDIPWYQSTWIDVTINNVNAKVQSK